MTFGHHDRQARLDALKSKHFDALIIGGGITGVATARDMAMRGFQVACIEKEDFAYGTSSRSSKLIHGGLRYLEQANFGLVFEGTHERATLRKVAPHLVRPIPFLYPVYESSKRGVWTVSLGLWMYDQLAGKRRYGRHTRHDVADLRTREPALRQEQLRGGAIYYDCWTDDARLCFENALSAHLSGASMLNRVCFVSPTRNEDKRIVGATVRDEESGQNISVRCKTLVHCTGPWTDQVLSQSGPPSDMLRPTKGVHVLVPRDVLPVQHAVVMSAVRDRRVVFAIPRGSMTLIGTTDTDFSDNPDDVYTTSSDVDYLLETVTAYFPNHAPTREHIRATYAGLRPLVRDDSESTYDVSREHTVVTRGDGTLIIAGGKYTTYRRMADDLVGAVMQDLKVPRRERPPCPTANALLPGAAQYDASPEMTQSGVSALVEKGVPQDMAQHLVATYGSRHTLIDCEGSSRMIDGLPYCWAEVDHCVLNEAALGLSDILIRRLAIFYEAPDQGLECAKNVAERMQTLLDWDDLKRANELSRYENDVATSRRWQN